jgi:hypothetical protein
MEIYQMKTDCKEFSLFWRARFYIHLNTIIDSQREIRLRVNHRMMDKEKCMISLKPDKILGYTLELVGQCKTEIDVIESLPERRQNYLKRRITHSSESSST